MASKSQLESILFLASKPMTHKSLAKILNAEVSEIEKLIRELSDEYQTQQRGIRLALIEDQVQLVSNPENAALADLFLKEEISGELTRPSLEALTVIAYRGPISKPELEMIRGVNCSLILRNLLLRGLVEEKIDPKTKLPKYSITFDFLRFLGVTSPKDLPDYQKLSSSLILEQWLSASSSNQSAPAQAGAAPASIEPPRPAPSV